VVDHEHIDGHGLLFQSKPEGFLNGVEESRDAGVGITAGGSVDIGAFEAECVFQRCRSLIPI